MAKGDVLEVRNDGPGPTSFDVAFSATPSSGDLLIFITAIYSGADASGAAVAGATEIADSGDSGETGFRRLQIFGRVCGGSETNSYAVSATSGTYIDCISYRIEGVFADLSGITASLEQYTNYVTTLAIPASAIAYSADSRAIVASNSDASTTTFSGFGATQTNGPLFAATATVTGSGTLQTTATCNAEVTDISGAMILIQTGAGGGGSKLLLQLMNS